jgi:hypothetical protein
MERPNWLLDIPADEYHAATKRNEYTTSHRLNLFRKCPALYKKTIDGEIVEGDTAAFAFGRATHVYIIEGKEKFDAEYVVSDGPINEKTGKPYGKLTAAYAKWAAEQPKPVVGTEDFAMLQKMREAVHAHPVAKDLLASGIAEGTIRTEWNGEPVQARLDWFALVHEGNRLVDLKTCNDIDRFRFDIRDFGYVEQMAFYAECVRLVSGSTPVCWLVAVEKKEPYRVAVVHIGASTIDDAIHGHMGGETWRDDADAMLLELRKCRETGIWPTRYEQVINI